MNIVIVGAGVVGSNLADELSRAGHRVSIVDRDPSVVRRVGDRADVLAVAGSGTRPSVLRQAGIAEAEMVIAVTSVDEINLVIGMLAHQLGVRHTIARIRNTEFVGPEALLDPSRLGIDSIISPEGVITASLLRILSIPGSTDVAALADGKVLLVSFEIEADAPIAGKRLAQLREMSAMDAFLVVAIFRDERAIIPKGDDTVEAGDHIAVLANADTLPLVLPLIKHRVETPRRVVVSGAGLVGLRLCAELESSMEQVVLIEPDPLLAEEAAKRLERTVVLNGEATDAEVLREADVSRSDFFMALADGDEYNLLSALLARRLKAARVAVLSHEPTYVPVLADIGLDVVVNPRLVTVGEILRFIRKGPVHTITRLKESEAEVMELQAVPGARILDKPLKSVKFPNGSIIGAVIRDGEMHIPGGEFCIRSGDLVVVFTLPEAIARIEKLFSRKGLFAF